MSCQIVEPRIRNYVIVLGSLQKQTEQLTVDTTFIGLWNTTKTGKKSNADIKEVFHPNVSCPESGMKVKEIYPQFHHS